MIRIHLTLYIKGLFYCSTLVYLRSMTNERDDSVYLNMFYEVIGIMYREIKVLTSTKDVEAILIYYVNMRLKANALGNDVRVW